MLKILPVTHNEKGFILPLVLFITAIVMVIVLSGIQIYKNNIQLTHHHIQQLKIETLLQSALTRFKQELKNGDITLPGSSDELLSTSYTFPDGQVEIHRRMVDKEKEETEDTGPQTDKDLYRLRCVITMEDLSYSFIHFVAHSEKDKEG
ncbi:MAG TPA: hypothetical protein VK111_00085 [Virgibacillus sp.]|nr:hypothetical protein [Virgibacillus sp.]